jgi:type VI secretion system protein ImpB
MSEFEQRTQRMNLTLQRKGSDGNDEEVELPLKLLVTGNFQGVSGEVPIAEGSTVNINKDNFNTIMHATAPRLRASVANCLLTPPELSLDICFRSMEDFHPDNIIRQVPSLDRLCRLRELLYELKRKPEDQERIIEQIIRLAAE